MGLKRLLKFIKPVGIVLGTIALLVLTLIVLIRSPYVMSRILPPIQAKLEKDFNLKTKIAGLSVDPFARLEVQGIEADWAQASLGKVKISVESVLVRFSFWELLQRRLVVSEVEVIKPQIDAELTLPEKSPPSPPANPLPLLKNLILNPPATVDLSAVAVRDLKLDVRFKQGSLTSRMHLENLNLSSDLNLSNRVLSAGLTVNVKGNSDKLAASSQSGFLVDAKNISPTLPSVYLSLEPEVDLSTRLDLSFADVNKPFIELKDSNLALMGKRVLVNLKLQKAGAVKVELTEFKSVNALPLSLRVSLVPIYELESLSGEEFQKQLTPKVIALVKDLSTSLGTDLVISDLRTQLKLPADGIDAAVGLSATIPLKLELSPQDLALSSQGKPIIFSLTNLSLKGSAFSALNQNLKLDLLSGLKVETPLQLSVTAPSLTNLKKPLTGLRLSQFDIAPQLSWGKTQEKLLMATVALAQSASGDLTVKLDNQLKIHERLLNFVPALKPLYETLGLLDVRAQLNTTLNTQWRDLQTATEVLQSGVRKLALSYDVQLEQTTPPPKKSPTALNLAGGLRIQGQLDVPQPALLKEIRATTNIDWAQSPLLKNQLTVSNLANRLAVSGQTEIAALLRLRKITPLAEQLGMLGGTQINAKWNVGLPHNAPSILVAKIPPPQLMTADVDVDAQIRFVEKPVMPLFEKNMLQIAGPLKAKIKAGLNRGSVNVNVAYDLPQAGIPALAVVNVLKGNLSAKTKIDLSGGVDVGVQADVGNVTPAKSFGLPEEVLPYLKEISARLTIQSDIQNRVDIRQGLVNTGKDKLKVTFKGGTDLKATNSRFEGQLAVKPPKIFKFGIRAQDKVTLDGVIQTAWELTQKEQKSIRLRGQAMLDNFSAQHQLGGIRNASGQIPFQQELELPNFKSLRWSYLIQDNPFKRVDASKFVPLLSEDSMLTIGELNALEKKFGPLRGRFSLKQNMLSIDRLDADLFDGVLAGQGFVDIQPSRLTAGLQGRVTKINTALLAAKPEKATPAPLSARLAMVVDLSKSLVEGRVDVTEIGKNQLLAMMDILDPSGADALLNKARLALSVGYPTYVGLQMQQGFLDLDVGLGGLVAQRFKIPNLPLTPIINAKTQDLVKTMREVPIQ